MDTMSVAYVLCRIEDDSSLTPVSRHGDFLTRLDDLPQPFPRLDQAFQ